MIKRLKKCVLFGALVIFSGYAQSQNVNIKLAFLTQKLATPPALSNLDPVLTV